MRHILINGSPKSATLYLASAVEQLQSCARMRIATRGLWSSQVDVEAIETFLGLPAGVAQQHIAPTGYNLRLLREFGLTRFVLVVRDPRDVLVSWFHHLHREDIRASRWHYALCLANDLLSEHWYGLDHGSQLDALVERAFPQFQAWIREWLRIVDCGEHAIRLVRYEDFVLDVRRSVEDLLAFFGIVRRVDESELPPTHSAEPAQIDRRTHFRRGRVGSYRDELAPPQVARLNDLVDAGLYTRLKWSVQ
jgi:hypothetical protein